MRFCSNVFLLGCSGMLRQFIGMAVNNVHIQLRSLDDLMFKEFYVAC